MSGLAGQRILVTRAEHQAGRLSRELAKHGAEPVEIPTIRILPAADFAPLDAALRQLSSYGWMLVTSANTVNVLLARMEELGMVVPGMVEGGSQTWRAMFGPMPKIAAVGPATAKAVRRMGWDVDLLPEKYVAESLLEALGDRLRGERVLLARSALARDVIPDALRELGIQVDVVDAYRTEIPRESLIRVSEVFAESAAPLDAATFTSASTVENFVALLREAGQTAPPPNLPAISIGPVTSASLRAAGWEPVAEATEHHIDGLVKAVLAMLTARD